MRILHIADLHIGKTLLGFSLREDQKYILDQMLSHIRSASPDIVLLAGDIYDKPIPSTEAVSLLDAFLTALSVLEIPVIAIAGNHDSPERLTFGSGILSRAKLHIIGRFIGALERITLEDTHGPVHFYALPFIKPSMLRDMEAFKGQQDLSALFSAILATTPIDPKARNVLISHQFYTSAREASETSDSEIHVGALENIDASLIAYFDYAALGHLHNPQTAGYPHVRYAGSPLQYSFSEALHKKSITRIDLREKGSMEISQLPLIPLRQLRRIRGRLADLIQPDILAQGNAQDYLHITLTDDIEPMDPLGTLRQYYPNTAALSWENARSGATGYTADAPIEQPDLPALFSRFFEEQNGAALSEAQARVMDDMLRAAQEAL